MEKPSTRRGRKVAGGRSPRVIRARRLTARKGSRFTAVIERDVDTGLLVGYVPGFPGAHSQGETVDELTTNLSEVIGMLLEDGEPRLEAEFVGTQQLLVG